MCWGLSSLFGVSYMSPSEKIVINCMFLHVSAVCVLLAVHCRWQFPSVQLCDIDTIDATCIDNLCGSQWSYRVYSEHIVLFVLDVLMGTGPHKHARINAHTHTHSPTCVNTGLHMHTRACTFTKSIYCNSFIYGGSVYLAYVMGRLIGGFSNYELGKASGWRRQSDPSLLL